MSRNASKQPNSGLLLPDCPLCATKKAAQTVTVLRSHQDASLLHVVCKKCRGAVLMLCIEGEHGMRSVGLVTDLAASDIERISGKPGLSLDDAIELHKMLKGPSFLRKLRDELPVRVRVSGFGVRK